MIKFITITLALTFLAIGVSGNDSVDTKKSNDENDRTGLKYVCKLMTTSSTHYYPQQEELAFHEDKTNRNILVSIFSNGTRQVFEAKLKGIKINQTAPTRVYKISLGGFGNKDRYFNVDGQLAKSNELVKYLANANDRSFRFKMNRNVKPITDADGLKKEKEALAKKVKLHKPTNFRVRCSIGRFSRTNVAQSLIQLKKVEGKTGVVKCNIYLAKFKNTLVCQMVKDAVVKKVAPRGNDGAFRIYLARTATSDGIVRDRIVTTDSPDYEKLLQYLIDCDVKGADKLSGEPTEQVEETPATSAISQSMPRARARRTIARLNDELSK